MIQKFKMRIRLEDGSEHEENVQHCACYVGAVFEATNTVRFWNLHLRATDKRKELLRVYQVGEEQIDEQETTETHSRELNSDNPNINDIRNRTISSGGVEERKDIVQSSPIKKSIVQHKLF